VAALEGLGVDAVYAPSAEDMYPSGPPRIVLDPGELGQRFEGAVRPGHFRGVLTVVAKLLARTGARAAVFGEKDAQQLALVRRMVHDLDLGVKILAAPTRRDDDGLALSSRNAYLSRAERAEALALPRAIAAGAAAAAAGLGAAAVRQVARDAFGRGAAPTLPEYMDLVAPKTFEPVGETWSGEALLIGARKAGSTRLIDNARVLVAPR
jgi:pantoate--beta-alanine ligase